MTNAIETPIWIRIEAPDAITAFALERRLVHLHPSAVGRRGTWVVEIEDFDDRGDEIEAAIRYWLRGTGRESATVHVGDVQKVVRADPLAEPPLGAGYDSGGVLEHEP
jgi:hypothetical protein